METSKRIKARDHNTCQMCGCNDKPLSVHHLYYGDDGCIKVPDESLITLCDECHERQNECKSMNGYMFYELKSRLTDFELYNLLSNILNDYTIECDIPVHWRNTTPNKRIITECDNDNKLVANLSKWRQRIYNESFKLDAIRDYTWAKENNKAMCNDIEDWFKIKYGMDILEFIELNKNNIEESIISK